MHLYPAYKFTQQRSDFSYNTTFIAFIFRSIVKNLIISTLFTHHTNNPLTSLQHELVLDT
ncbi:hypothetical protein THOD04_90221 [Vibrio owensii]|nr:hypothetical protein THOD04_90221 [Vibrio owensii]